MNKKVIIIGAIVVIAIIAVVVGVMFFKKDDSSMKLETAQDMETLINQIYKNLEGKLPSLQTQEISKDDEYALSTYTGLKSADNIEAIVVSEPMMSSQAYSLAIVKTNKNADIEAMKQEMIDNIDTRKWICVEAEKVYVTNYKDVIFLVMADDEWATPVYDEFKNLVGGKVGKELVKNAEF